jgi:hypothetical protein
MWEAMMKGENKMLPIMHLGGLSKNILLSQTSAGRLPLIHDNSIEGSFKIEILG